MFDEVSLLLDQIAELAQDLSAEKPARRPRRVPALRFDRVAKGSDICQIVGELSTLRDAILRSWEAEPTPPAYTRMLNLAIDQVLEASAEQFTQAARTREQRLHDAARRTIANRDECLGVVAHDLSNPLNTILLSAAALQTMELRGEHACAAQSHVQMILRAAGRMRRLVGDLVDVASIRSGKLKIEVGAHLVGSIVAEAIDPFVSCAREKSVELTRYVENDVLRVRCDRDRIVQVLSNLLDNALKATSAGGTIDLHAEAREADVLFAVADTGRGISRTELPHVFERYWRGEKAGYRGTGRGLAIAKAVIEAHAGRIWAESEEGCGSTFLFTLPLWFSREQLPGSP
jgi:signal transduction histidine kinase